MRAIIRLSSAILIVSLILGSATLSASDKAFQFTWDPNPENDIAGYRLFCRLDGDSYNYNEPIWEGEETLSPVFLATDFADGIHYFVLRAFDTSGNESGNSNEVSYGIDNTAPGAPTGCTLIEVSR